MLRSVEAKLAEMKKRVGGEGCLYFKIEGSGEQKRNGREIFEHGKL